MRVGLEVGLEMGLAVSLKLGLMEKVAFKVTTMPINTSFSNVLVYIHYMSSYIHNVEILMQTRLNFGEM